MVHPLKIDQAFVSRYDISFCKEYFIIHKYFHQIDTLDLVSAISRLRIYISHLASTHNSSFLSYIVIGWNLVYFSPRFKTSSTSLMSSSLILIVKKRSFLPGLRKYTSADFIHTRTL